MILINYTIWPLIGSLAISLFAIFVLFYRPKNLSNLLFILFCLTVAIWLFGTYKMFLSRNDSEVIFWDRFIYIGVTMMSIILYHFGVVYLNLLDKNKLNQRLVEIGYILGLFFLVVSQFSTKFIDGVFHYEWGVHTIAGPLHHIFLLFFLLYFFGFLYQLTYFYRRCQGVAKTQLGYITIGFFIFLFIGPLAYLPAYQTPTFPVVYIAIIPFILLLFHAMFKYEFLSEFDELLLMRAKNDVNKSNLKNKI